MRRQTPVDGRFLLDTNIIIALFAKDPKIHDRMANAEAIFVSCITIGEMYFGAYKSLKIQENISRIDEFVLKNTVLSCNTETAKIYGDIKNRLKDNEQPIPGNDIWLAAIAQQYGLILVTKDSHFDAIGN